MCQLCPITDIANGNRWPKGLEHHKSDITFLVQSAHEEHAKLRTKSQTNQPSSDQRVEVSDPLLEYLRLLNVLLEEVELDRGNWWSSPQKREQRRNLELQCDQKKLGELHKINNRVVEAVEGMQMRIGVFVKWALGWDGGVWELLNCEKGGKVEETKHVAVKAE